MKVKFSYYAFILTTILLISCKEKPVPPGVSTVPITAITSTTAVSGGDVTDGGGAPVISRGVCWNTSDNPGTSDFKTKETGGSGPFISNLAQLAPNTTYFVRAYATNSAGTGYGTSVSFKTSGERPVLSVPNASAILTTSATLNGTVNPNSLSTTVTFDYGLTTAYTGTLNAEQSPVNGSSAVNVTSALTGLAPGKTYHFRMSAENSFGVVYSDDITFTTFGQSPTVTTQDASGIQIHSAVLNAIVNPNYLSTTAVFEWGISAMYGNYNTISQNPLSGNSPASISVELTGLTAATTYHFRIRGENTLGRVYGNDMIFKTSGQTPTAITPAVSNLQMTSAKLLGVVNPNNLSTAVTFEWGTSLSYGNTIVSTQSPVNGNTPVNIDAVLSGLTPKTTYYFRVKATNESGAISYSEYTMFKTFTLADIDNNLYHSVNIGTQEWLTENLKTTHYNDGTSIPLVTKDTEWNSLRTNAYCWYENDAGLYKDTYGALYNYFVVNQTYNSNKNICPSGWHVPAKAEWTRLFDYLITNGYGFGGSGDKIAKSLAATSGWDNDPTPGTVGNNQSGNNSSGFTALPGGLRRDDNYSFYTIGSQGRWWATPDDYSLEYFYWYSSVNSNSSTVGRYNCSWTNGLSIRCVKD